MSAFSATVIVQIRGSLGGKKINELKAVLERDCRVVTFQLQVQDHRILVAALDLRALDDMDATEKAARIMREARAAISWNRFVQGSSVSVEQTYGLGFPAAAKLRPLRQTATYSDAGCR